MFKSRAARSGRNTHCKVGSERHQPVDDPWIVGELNSICEIAREERATLVVFINNDVPGRIPPNVYALHNAVDAKSLRVLLVDRYIDVSILHKFGEALASKGLRRTIAAGSIAACTHSAPGPRLLASMMLPPMTMTGTRSHQALYIAIEACCSPTTPWQIMAIGLRSILAEACAILTAISSFGQVIVFGFALPA